MRQWKAQDAIGQLEAQPPQQPLPQATLAGVDHQLEDAVDQDQSQEAEAERQQHVRLCQVDAVEQAHGMAERSEEHTSELQSLMRISYAVFCLKKKLQSQSIQPKSIDVLKNIHKEEAQKTLVT